MVNPLETRYSPRVTTPNFAAPDHHLGSQKFLETLGPRALLGWERGSPLKNTQLSHECYRTTFRPLSAEVGVPKFSEDAGAPLAWNVGVVEPLEIHT